MKKIIITLLLAYVVAIVAIWLDGLYGGAELSDKPAEYAVVLGNQVLPSGEPSPRLQARLNKAAELYHQGKAKQIIVSGGMGKEGYDEAAVMKRYLQTKNIPSTKIMTDANGYNTRMTAQNTHAWIDPTMHDDPIIVVSQLYHLSRTMMAFEQEGFKQVSGAFPYYFEGRDFYASLREVPAWLKYKIITVSK